MVTFSPLNLTESSYPALTNNTTGLDFISCRNVTIYFDRETTKMVINRFYEALRPEGWLLVGHAEPQAEVYDAFTHHHLDGAVLYQKPSIQTVPVVRSSPPPAPTPKVDIAPTPAPPKNAVDDVSVLLANAQAAANQEDWQAALALLIEVELIAPYQPMLHYLRGLVYTHLEEPSTAVQAFRQAVYCQPDFPLAHYAIGELMNNQGRRTVAEASWRRAYKSVTQLAPDSIVTGADDLTAGMLRDLLSYRLQYNEESTADV